MKVSFVFESPFFSILPLLREVLLLFQDCKSSQTKTQNYLDKSRVKFRSRVRVQQQRHMTETRNNCQDVHDVTQLEMSLTFLPLPNYREAEIRIHFN